MQGKYDIENDFWRYLYKINNYDMNVAKLLGHFAMCKKAAYEMTETVSLFPTPPTGPIKQYRTSFVRCCLKESPEKIRNCTSILSLRFPEFCGRHAIALFENPGKMALGRNSQKQLVQRLRSRLDSSFVNLCNTGFRAFDQVVFQLQQYIMHIVIMPIKMDPLKKSL